MEFLLVSPVVRTLNGLKIHTVELDSEQIKRNQRYLRQYLKKTEYNYMIRCQKSISNHVKSLHIFVSFLLLTLFSHCSVRIDIFYLLLYSIAAFLWNWVYSIGSFKPSLRSGVALIFFRKIRLMQNRLNQALFNPCLWNLVWRCCVSGQCCSRNAICLGTQSQKT